MLLPLPCSLALRPRAPRFAVLFAVLRDAGLERTLTFRLSSFFTTQFLGIRCGPKWKTRTCLSKRLNDIRLLFELNKKLLFILRTKNTKQSHKRDALSFRLTLYVSKSKCANMTVDSPYNFVSFLRLNFLGKF